MPNDRQYEFVYVLAPTVANAEVEAIQGELDEQIRKLGGSVENTDLWGRRKLAYPIGNFTEGIYVVQLLRGPGEMVTELERRLRVKDDVLRYLTVRVDEDLRKVRRVAEKKKADAERRRARRPQGEPAPQPATEPADEAPAEGEPPPPEVTPPSAPATPSASDEAAPAEGESSPPEATLSASDEAAPAEGEPSPPEATPSVSEEAVDEPPSAPPAAESDEPAGS